MKLKTKPYHTVPNPTKPHPTGPQRTTPDQNEKTRDHWSKQQSRAMRA